MCAIYFRDGIEEMMRNPSSFVNLFIVNNWLQFPK